MGVGEKNKRPLRGNEWGREYDIFRRYICFHERIERRYRDLYGTFETFVKNKGERGIDKAQEKPENA